MGVAAAVFIGSAAPEVRISTRLFHPGLLAAAGLTALAAAVGFMALEGATFRVLEAAEASMAAAGSRADTAAVAATAERRFTPGRATRTR
jgi:hypothetical protein